MVLSNNERLLVEVVKTFCTEHGISYESFSYDWIFTLTKNDVTKHIWGYDFELNANTGYLIARDKSATYELLSHSNIPAVPHHIFLKPNESGYMSSEGNWHTLTTLFAEHNNDVVCKNNFGTGGTSVARAQTIVQLERIVHDLFRRARAIAVSPYIAIASEYRIIILDNECLLAYEKIPANTAEGEFITHNISHGGEARTVEASPQKDELIAMAQKAMRALNLRYASVDIIRDAEGALQVLEINEGVSVEYFAKQSDTHRTQAEMVYTKALEALLLT